MIDGSQREHHRVVGRMSATQARSLFDAVLWAQDQLAEEAAPDDVAATIDETVQAEAPWLTSFLDGALVGRAVTIEQRLGFIMVLLTFFGFDPVHTDSLTSDSIAPDELHELFAHHFGA